jgi:hypothetical protein
MKVRSKRGTTAVFLTMILAAVLAAVGIIVYEASQLAGESYSDAVLELAGRSILAEYDTELQERYGLFAFNLEQNQVENKINYYASYSFHNNQLKETFRSKKHLDQLRLKVESVSVDLKGYSIINTELFQNQILDTYLYDLGKNLIKPRGVVPSGFQEIELKNMQVINSLPSKGAGGGTIDIGKFLENGIPSPAEIKEKSEKAFLTNEYILGRFWNHRRGSESRDTFFMNEVEYILIGNFNDQENYNSVRNQLFLMRTGLNLTHIYADNKKRNEIVTLAEVLTPGPLAAVTQAVIAGIWSAAEAENDLRRLEDGKKIPLVKMEKHWAVSIENAVRPEMKREISDMKESLGENGEQENLELGKSLHSKKQSAGYIEPVNKNGMDYEDYLRILLFLENNEIKLQRTMDLIQINLKGSYHKDFDLKYLYGGFEFDAVIKGKTYAYIQKY